MHCAIYIRFPSFSISWQIPRRCRAYASRSRKAMEFIIISLANCCRPISGMQLEVFLPRCMDYAEDDEEEGGSDLDAINYTACRLPLSSYSSRCVKCHPFRTPPCPGAKCCLPSKGSDPRSGQNACRASDCWPCVNKHPRARRWMEQASWVSDCDRTTTTRSRWEGHRSTRGCSINRRCSLNVRFYESQVVAPWIPSLGNYLIPLSENAPCDTDPLALRTLSQRCGETRFSRCESPLISWWEYTYAVSEQELSWSDVER